MQCEVTDCGHTENGLWVRAITDCLGSQVVVTRGEGEKEETICMSKPKSTHAKAVSLGRKVVAHGIDIYHEWTGPIDDLGEFEKAMLFSPNLGEKMTLPVK